ncbi:Lrp/AsnC family transcriptional regulator [Denitromonas iodatirespirans]|uniref:Lrp/AsnC family transcriptional regulator n=1 Tax=Denitromonas iodatirespirans TaxID=2795389 RepID=A0A944DM26_DENI1|nr:Lrp/AsnC family transcriptional regulator [Denitromonas iodatirespirans]MBT0961159.1 Lrp/AsnC family transcriptional regulator [Denitromonas iodatirespirans]
MDKVDAKILSALQDDARMTVAELSERVALTSSPCWRRVKALEETGVIRGYHAELDPRRLGYDVTAFVNVMLENHRADLGDSFEIAVQGIPQVVACHNVSGRYDFMLEVVAPDLEAFGEFARNVLRTLPGVKEIYSSFSLKSIKRTRSIPIPPA